MEDFERFLERILGISSISAENGEMSENVYLSTAPRREANSRGCRGTKMVQNGAPEGPRGGLLDTLGGLGGSLGTLGSSLGALWGPGWLFTPILEHFWLHFGRPNGAEK